MKTTRAVLLLAALGLSAAGCNCGIEPVGNDAGATGGGMTGGGGGATGGGGGTTGGGGMTGGGGGAPGPNVVEFASASGRVGQASGLSGDVQLGVAPARLRASGGTLTLEGSAVLQP
jgi:hypothetical protein